MGILLSPFATLPIALAAIISVYSGIAALFASAFILLLINPQEAVIFLLTTGPLGLALGANYVKGIIQSVFISGVTLLIGINILTHIVGIAVFGDMTPNSAPILTASIFILFSLLYSGIWLLMLKFFINILKRTNQFSIFDSYRKK
ncbi:MAG: hypothetical protein AB7G87_09205 [Clostridia bacterium]